MHPSTKKVFRNERVETRKREKERVAKGASFIQSLLTFTF